MALRVYMGFSFELGDTLTCSDERLFHTGPCSAADHIMAIEDCVQLNRGVKILVESGIEALQLRDGQSGKFASFIHTESDGRADYLMRAAEWDALVGKISCGSKGV